MSDKVLHCTEHIVLYGVHPLCTWEGHGEKINKIVYGLNLEAGGEERSCSKVLTKCHEMLFLLQRARLMLGFQNFLCYLLVPVISSIFSSLVM